MLFNTNTGVYIKSLNKNSPLLGPKGLYNADIVTSINDCSVKNEDDWYECLNKMKLYKPGFCATAEIVHELDESDFLKHLSNGLYDCCSSEKTGYLCFEYLDNNNGVLEIPPHACLPARVIVEKSAKYCTLSEHCPESYHCIKPYMDNNTNILVISRLNNNNKIVYIGHPNDLAYTVHISPFIPKHVFSTTAVPDFTIKLMSYLCIFNIGLAVVNVLPCVFMDGQHITNTVVYLLLRKQFNNSQTTTISLMTSLLGMILLISHCVYVLLRLVF